MDKKILGFGTGALLASLFSLCSGAAAQSQIEPMDWIGTGFMLVLLLAALALFAFWIWVLVWVYKDAERRGMEGVLWLIVVLVAGVIGLIIYLIIRGSPPVKIASQTQPMQPVAQEVQAFQLAEPIQKSIKCPSCRTVFHVWKNPSGPTPIKCPNCGKEGTIL